MIVPMKKATIIVLDRFRTQSLRSLRKLGVVHVEQQRPAASEELTRLQERRSLIQRALAVLSPAAVEQAEERQAKGGDRGRAEAQDRAQTAAGQGRTAAAAALEHSLRMADEALERAEKVRAVQESIERLNRELDRLAPWGEFDPEDIRALARKGVYLRLYELRESDLRQLAPSAGHTFLLYRSRDLVRLAAVFLEEEAQLQVAEVAAEVWPLPERGAGAVRELLEAAQGELAGHWQRLRELGRQRAVMEESLRGVEQHLEFEEVRAGMGSEEALAYLRGYVPAKRADALRQAAAGNGWGLMLEDPTETDPVPTLIENPRWIAIIRPVFSFLGTVPGYFELDISFWFLMFFSLFFGMLIGDAGYGLVLLLVTILARLKFRTAPGGPFALMYVLAGATVVWGVLSGTWFGSAALARNPVLSRVVIPNIASFGYQNTKSYMFICFVIGAIQLTVAHVRLFFKQLPRLKAFANLGWVSMLWGLLFLIRYVVLQEPLHPLSFYLILPGLILVVVFAEQRGHFLKGLLVGIGTLPLKLLNSISAFSDIISYVRLFAVGLATVEVAKSFNGMAGSIGFGVPTALIAAVVLVFGHTLNILMGALSVIVHGIRLNMLEFSGHIGMEWTGIPYEPFKEREEEESLEMERSKD